MKSAFLVLVAGCVALIACGKPTEHPEVAYRHCLQKYAREIGEPTYVQAVAFSRKCEALAVEAAEVRTRDELGVRFNPKTSETVNRIRENHELIVRAHVCAFAVDRPIPPCSVMM